MTGYKEIKIPEADNLIVSSNVLIFDLRDHLSYECGHIVNSIHFDKENLFFLIENMNKDVPIIFYSNSKSEAEKMAKFFSDFNFQQCFYLAEDYEDWLAYQEQKTGMSNHVRQWLNNNGYTGEDINQRGFNGETPLMTAARKGNTECVVELISQGASLDLQNYDGNSAVWLACYSNNLFLLLALIQAGADINIQNVHGATPLIYASSSGRWSMVQMLLQAGANQFLTTHEGFTALDVASSLAILKVLRHVQKGGVIDIQPLEYLMAS